MVWHKMGSIETKKKGILEQIDERNTNLSENFKAKRDGEDE